MKIKYILNEIGETMTVPSGARFNVTEYKGNVVFNFLELKYKIDIRVLFKQENRITLAIDFETDKTSYDMTNQHQALKAMSYIVGSIDAWLKKYKTKIFKNESFNIIYIKFNPKAESSEQGADNRRNRLYQAFISKFAKKYNSTATFTESGGIVASFKPPIQF